MNSYKQSAEYAFDLLEHFYNKHHNQILSIGKENIFILIPTEIYNLLESKDENNISHFPIAFRKIKIEEYPGSRILFCLKEDK